MKHPAILVWLLAAALAPSATAGSGPSPAPSTSSIAQYVEQAPTAAGSVPLGRGSGAVAKLTPAAKKALSTSGGADASTLQQLAVDPQDGAPAKPHVRQVPTRVSAAHAATSARHAGTQRTTGQEGSGAVGLAPATHTPSAVSAAGSTVGGGNVWVLGLVLVAVTAAAVLLARRRRPQ